MNLISRIFGRPGSGGPDHGDFRPEHVEQLLESQSRWASGIDPETSQQWRLLKVALERKAHPVPAQKFIIRVARPAAAVAALGAVVLLVALLWHPGPDRLAYATGRGQQSSVVLSDSSEVTLNHTSELIVEKAGPVSGRRVRLQGEAFFRVRKSAVPFIVMTDVASVEVLGTDFNVRVRGDRLEVAVVHGAVRVSSEAASASVTLQTGQFTSCSRGGSPELPSEASFHDYPGWLHGKLLFDRAGLQDACREIADRFDVRVNVDIRQQQPTITGAIDAPTAEAALRTLARLTGNRYRHDENGHTLY